jgi:GTPase SAR1 family protein
VSPQLGLLTKLWNFDLKSSLNIKEPLMLDSLVKQRTKTSDVLGYLKSILEDSRPYARVKLMFVGVQAIGKTSLLNKLREEGTSTTSVKKQQTWSERSIQSSINSTANISTVGIDINEWIYEKPRQKSNSSASSSSLATG